LTPNFNGLWLHLRVADNSEFHSSPEAFGHMSPLCRFSDLGPFRLRIFSAQVGNRTRAHGDESNPSSVKCNERRTRPCHRAYSIRGSTPFHSCVEVRLLKLVSSEDWTGARAPSASYCSTEGVAPLHTAPPVPVKLGLKVFPELLNPVFRIRDVLVRIRTTDFRIRIWILLFTIVAFKISIKLSLFTKFKFFCLLLTVGTFTSVFKDNKLWISHNTVEINFL
jgi:hypothetical protein